MMFDSSPSLATSGAWLDPLLDDVCLTLQITPTQFDLAQQRYTAVGEWLAAADSPLHGLRPEIYLQGSAALRTTNKPRGREEYDVDLVLELRVPASDPMVVYGLAEGRLRDHGDYRQRLERKPRCLRLNYANDFHLDILPARPDGRRGGTCIEVPDRTLKVWKPSNPKGYVRWFEGRCEIGPAAVAKRQQVPLPQPLPDALTGALRRAVQLLKRRRDNFFRDQRLAPRSIILTTLAGHYYDGKESTFDAVRGIVSRVEQAIKAAGFRRLEVYNPTNDAERLSEQWDDSMAYAAFGTFLRQFGTELQELATLTGLDALGAALNTMFGGALGDRAIRRIAERVAKAKEDRTLGFAGGALVVGGGLHRSPTHTFHHGAS